MQDLASHRARAASLPLRLTAWLMDILVIGGLSYALWVVASGAFQARVESFRLRLLARVGQDLPPDAVELSQLLLAATAVVLTVLSAYFLTEGLFGRALGKRILHLQIVNADGQPAGIGTLLMRYLAKVGGALMMLAGVFAGVPALYAAGQVLATITVLGCLAALARSRFAAHDLVSGTAVYRSGYGYGQASS